MLRWLWRLQSDRGGQHAEAGVLMATLIVLAGAVTVGSVPQLSTAVSNQWVCHISDRGNEQCRDDASKGEVKAGKTFTAKTFGSGADATPAGYTDPADSHFPPVETDEAPNYTATLGGSGGEVAMQSCSIGTESCVGQDGTYYQCKTKGHIDPKGPRIYTAWEDCTVSFPSTKGLTCTDEGLSTTVDTCYNADGIFHCYQVNGPDDIRCNDADNDADASIPGGQPISCGKLTGDSATCLGSNGTLYQCPDINKLDNCTEGGRNISPTDPGLTDCVPIVSHGDTTGQVVRCTYTPTSCNPQPAEGTCADQAVSVRCLKDAPTDPNIEYQHCQSLGEIVEPGHSLVSACVVKAQNTCRVPGILDTQRAASPDHVVDTIDAGGVSIDITDEYTADLSIPTGETGPDGKPVRKDMSYPEMKTFCTTHGQQCQKVAAATQRKNVAAYKNLLSSTGLCAGAADCDVLLGQMQKVFGSGGNGRKLLGASGYAPLTKTQLGAHLAFGGAGLGTVANYYVPEKYKKTRQALVGIFGTIGFAGAVLFGLSTSTGNAAVNAITDRLTTEEATTVAGRIATSTAQADASNALAQAAANAAKNADLENQIGQLRDALGQAAAGSASGLQSVDNLLGDGSGVIAP